MMAFSSIRNTRSVTILRLAKSQSFTSGILVFNLRHVSRHGTKHGIGAQWMLDSDDTLCASTPAEPAPGRLGAVSLRSARHGSHVLTIDQTHEPAGTKLTFDFSPSGRAVAVTLVKSHSYTCRKGFPSDHG